ncbi:MAG TPA: hypothetical protein VJV78_18080 [Polyangiales bacterium]|nr:hypothetical protein [Polyangiales bacterium]
MRSRLLQCSLNSLRNNGQAHSGACGVIGAGIKLGAGRSVVVHVANGGRIEDRLVFNAAWV